MAWCCVARSSSVKTLDQAVSGNAVQATQAVVPPQLSIIRRCVAFQGSNLALSGVESADKETMILGWNVVGGHTAPDE